MESTKRNSERLSVAIEMGVAPTNTTFRNPTCSGVEWGLAVGVAKMLDIRVVIAVCETN